MARPAGEDDDFDENPFASPESELSDSKPRNRKSAIERVKAKVLAPAICLVIVGSLGILASIVNIVIAAIGPAAMVDPNAPPFVQGIQQGSVGPVAMAIQAVFAVVNAVIIFGGVQMMRFQTRILAIVVSIVAIANFGSCCCVIGMPVGIWSIIILSSSDVIKAFDSVAS